MTQQGQYAPSGAQESYAQQAQQLPQASPYATQPQAANIGVEAGHPNSLQK